MEMKKAHDNVNHSRRRVLGAAALTFAAVELSMKASAKAASSPGAVQNAFGSLQEIDAGVLIVGYAEMGPPDGVPVILLHGWPYDIHGFVDVVPSLATQGYRAIVPYLRGYGPTRFRSAETFRNGQPSAVAQDTVYFMNALHIERAVLAGFDWGARTA